MQIRLSNSADESEQLIIVSIDKYFEGSTLSRGKFDKLESDSEKKDFIYKDFKCYWKYIQIDFVSK